MEISTSKLQENSRLGGIALFFLFAFCFSGSAAAQVNIDMTGKKILWEIEQKTMTRSQMEAICALPANDPGRVLVFQVYMTVPDAFPSKFLLGAGQMDIIIKTPSGLPMSWWDNGQTYATTGTLGGVVARHLAPNGTPNFLAFAQGLKGSYPSGLNGVEFPQLLKEANSAFSWQAAGYTPANSITHGAKTAIFNFPVYIENPGSFQLCFNSEAYEKSCEAFAQTSLGNSCPGLFALQANFYDEFGGAVLRNISVTGQPTDFFKGSDGKLDRTLKYNQLTCGGVKMNAGPMAMLTANDSACPKQNLIINFIANANNNITNFNIQYSSDNASWMNINTQNLITQNLLGIKNDLS